MSRRGSKRRQVVQLDASSSSLYRYGYSKTFTSSDKTASGLNLLGDYSDSESEGSAGDAENIPTSADPKISPSKADVCQGPDSCNDASTKTEIIDDNGEKDAACMDDELKNFLSEIEAIPMPTDSQTLGHDTPQESPSSAPSGIEEQVEPAPEQAPPSSPKKIEKRKEDVYSMFIKGDTEFTDHSNEKDDGQAEQQKEEENLNIPEEPTTHWQMVQDDATQYYYYWNWHTNEVTWEIPADYTQYLLLHKEYEEKISKYTPEQIEAFKEKQQQKQKLQFNGSTSVPFEGSVQNEKFGPQLPNGCPLADHTEAGDGIKSKPGHVKKKKSHKKHKKRRHKDEECGDEPEELASKSSTIQTKTHKQLPQLLSIVPYLSDEESENKDIPSPEAETEHNVLQNDPLSQPLPSKEKEHEDSIDTVADLNAESKDSRTEPLVDKDDSKSDQIVTDTILDKDPSNIEEEVLSDMKPTCPPSAEILPCNDHKQSEKENNESDTCEARSLISNLNVEIFPQDGSVSKDESSDIARLISKNMVMSEKDGDADGCLKTEQTTSLDCLKTEQTSSLLDGVPEPDDGKQEVEEGEISDSNDVMLNSLDVDLDKARDALPEVENQKSLSLEKGKSPEKNSAENLLNLVNYTSDDVDKASEDFPSGESQKTLPLEERQSQGKNIAGTLLNLIDYKSDDIEEEEEDEEEEGELREYKSQQKEKEENSMPCDDSSCSKERVESFRNKQSLTTHKSNESYPQQEKLHITSSEKKSCHSDISSSHLHEGNQTSDEGDETDIDFDDIEDIDRVLEKALEKKLDKKKVDEGHSNFGPSAANEDGEFVMSVTRDLPIQLEEVEKMERDENSKEHSDFQDSGDDLEDKINSMADLALNKLDFLEVGTGSLSKLQILYVELQTRIKDWNAGGLSTNYIYQQLQEAEELIEQYEVNAVPDGWLCQWDRIKHRYFYRNTVSNHIQLEYPQPERKTCKGDKKKEGSERRRRERESSEIDESHRQHASSRNSRHRRKEDKERNKHDRRSSDRHRKKRRRRRNHSSSSDSSIETSHHYHHKSKRKKKRKLERSRSPSVEVMEDIGGEHEPHIIEDSPPSASRISAAPLLQTDENSVDSLGATIQAENRSPAIPTLSPSSETKAAVPEYYIEPNKDSEEELINLDNEIDGVKIAEEVEEEEVDVKIAEEVEEEEVGVKIAEEVEEEEVGEESSSKPEEENSSAIISKPPQIIVPPHIAAMNPPEIYSFSNGNANSTLASTSLQSTTTSDNTEELLPKLEDSDKVGRKRKKEKAGKEKILATGSSLMMKKKRVSSMVQKWQQVKKEVEKEDLAKELQQAAIRERINQLK